VETFWQRAEIANKGLYSFDLRILEVLWFIPELECASEQFVFGRRERGHDCLVALDVWFTPMRDALKVGVLLHELWTAQWGHVQYIWSFICYSGPSAQFVFGRRERGHDCLVALVHASSRNPSKTKLGQGALCGRTMPQRFCVSAGLRRTLRVRAYGE
jgi:hypothetical protein